eukprot:snap_masked-scaffold_10-processed-gene-0.62-mRNA-1 protein AED:1.00 eAED:1.00 QI:0/0/0/0/1/1/2/0/70
MFTRVESFFKVYKETKYLRVLHLAEFTVVQEELNFLSSSRILSKSRLLVRTAKQRYWSIVGRNLRVSFFV